MMEFKPLKYPQFTTRGRLRDIRNVTWHPKFELDEAHDIALVIRVGLSDFKVLPCKIF